MARWTKEPMNKRLDDHGSARRDLGSVSFDDHDHDEDGDDEPDQYRVLPSVSVGGRRLRMATKWVLRIGIAFALIAAVAYGGYQYWYLRQVNPPGEDSVATVFTVTENDDLDSISRRLHEEGVIVNEGVFRRYVREEGGLEIVPGIYTLRGKDHMGNLLRVLRTPPQETLTRVTFPEGFTLSQMSRRLAENMNAISADDFLVKTGGSAGSSSEIRSVYQPEGIASLEGLLFPDTYFIAGNETATQVAQRMLQLMERVGRQEGLDDSQNLVGRTPYEVLIVASLIEREAKIADDRAKIARVIYNRLIMDMPLQIDATLFYQQDADRPFTELRELDTPYNTYLYKGLPPTPIANPGRASIAAALAPAPNPSAGDPLCQDLPAGTACVYLYYVLSDKDGGHTFAVTYEQHEANVQKAIADGVL
jgi:UPF0755 protein